MLRMAAHSHRCALVSRYADTTFMLIVASEKGQGKSVRAKRMASILPKGWCSANSAASARAGMNGTCF